MSDMSGSQAPVSDDAKNAASDPLQRQPASSSSSADAADDNNDSPFYVDEEFVQTIETGDSIKVKQVLDEVVVDTVRYIGYDQNFSWDNIKLLVMVASCVFAMVAQFYPLPFPESRPLLGACCAGYFFLSGVLQFFITFVDRNTIMTTNAAGKCPAVQIDTTFHRFQEFFVMIVLPTTNVGDEDPGALTAKMYVGRYFTEEGMFDQVGFARDVEKMMHAYQNGKRGRLDIFEKPIGNRKGKQD
jgi:signal peptidase complex subunit 2